jgi:hypothetical protein
MQNEKREILCSQILNHKKTLTRFFILFQNKTFKNHFSISANDLIMKKKLFFYWLLQNKLQRQSC